MRVAANLARIAVLIGLCAVRPAYAANPRINLNLENVTCTEALDALNRTTGVAIDLRGIQRSVSPTGRLSSQEAKLNERSTFQWSNVPLARALRELCSRYGLQFQRFGSQYTLLPGGSVRPAGAPAPGAKPRFLVERDGFRLFVTSVSTSSQRGLDLQTGENRSSGESLTLAFKVEWPEGEPDALVGFESIAARDDLGNVLQWRSPISKSPPPQLGPVFPDEWTANIQLLDPQPRARKLAWLEGELMVYAVYKPLSLDLPVTATFPVRGKVAGTDVELVRIDSAGTDPNAIQQRGPSVITRLTASADEPNAYWERARQFRLDLVGASGKVYPGRGTNSSGTTRNGQAIQELVTEFPPVPEPISKVIYRTVEKQEPRRLVSFRFENLPIPPADILPPVVAVPVPMGFKAPAHGPFYAEGGIDLQLQTELNGRAAPAGVLFVGLARAEAAGWGSVRWQETDVELGGLSRIKSLQPGKYRLLRTYRPRVAIDPGGDGRWEGGELEIEVAAGKSPIVAPLRWVSSRPNPKPGSGVAPKARPKPGPGPRSTTPRRSGP